MENENSLSIEKNLIYKDEEKDLTLKALLLKLIYYWKLCLKKWKFIALFTIVGTGIGLCYFILKPQSFAASLTFMVNEDDSSNSALTSILGQFGLGGKASGDYNLTKILELSSSRRIISEALFNKVLIQNDSDYIANHIIKIYDLHDEWEDSEIGLKGFVFTNGDFEKFNRIENAALQYIYKFVAGNKKQGVDGLFTYEVSDETSIMYLYISSKSELLSYFLVKNIYSNLSAFYVDKTIERQQKTYNLMVAKVDSLERVMGGKQFRIYKFNDVSRNLALQQYSTPKSTLERQLTAATLAYGEAIKNLEIADFSMKTDTPFFQLIDDPILPIQPSSLLRWIVIGFILGIVFSILYLVVFDLIKSTMSEI